MPCELTLKFGGKAWGVVRAELTQDGEVLNIDINLAQGDFRAKAWKPFLQATVVETGTLVPQLVWRTFDARQPKGVLNSDGSISRTEETA
jgi:hypothetical protein